MNNEEIENSIVNNNLRGVTFIQLFNREKSNIQKIDLLMYVANAYYYLLDYKFNNNNKSYDLYKKMKFNIKHITNLEMKEINDIFNKTSISNNPIRCLFNNLSIYLK